MRVAFIMEQHLGHRTFYQNLRRYVSMDPKINSRWVEISYYLENGWIERSKLIPAKFRGTIRGILQSRQGVRADQADAAFFNTQVPGVFSFDLLGSTPIILCTDITPVQYDLIAEEYKHEPDKGGIKKQFKHLVNRKLFQKAAHIIAWSNWVKDSLINDYGIPETKVSVIPPGVDLETWKPVKDSQNCCPMKILFVGGNFERKGGHILIEAFNKFDHACLELHLVTREDVGITPGVFTYHNLQPNSPELVQLYQNCDVFVLPSLAEAFGIAAVEALACGLPVIAARTGGLTDVVEDGGNGILIPPGDANALAGAIQYLLDDPDRYIKMSQYARVTAESRFDAKLNAEKCISIILDAAGKRHA